MKRIIFIFVVLGSILFADVLGCMSIPRITKSTRGINETSAIMKSGRLAIITEKSLSLSKEANIEDLIYLARIENRINFVDECKYLPIYKNMKNGDKILLKCLKDKECDMEIFSQLMTKSPMHIELASKFTNLSLAQLNLKVGVINENLMNKYFQSVGWTKIEGEVGRNGIDGLFIKRKNNVIADVMIVESKYNKSGLQITDNGQQMTKQWIAKKIENLQIKYPDNDDYNTIQKFIENDVYRARLWNIKREDDKLLISLKKVHDKDGKVETSKIEGPEQGMVNYKNNSIVSLTNPENTFQKQIVSWYKEEMTK